MYTHFNVETEQAGVVYTSKTDIVIRVYTGVVAQLHKWSKRNLLSVTPPILNNIRTYIMTYPLYRATHLYIILNAMEAEIYCGNEHSAEYNFIL